MIPAILAIDPMGAGRNWAARLLSPETYFSIQFWAGAVVLVSSLFQLHVARKFRWPLEPGRLTIFGGYVGLVLRSSRLALRFGDLGAYADFTAAIVGRLGIALQAAVALFAMDDVTAAPSAPRPLITWMLVAVVMIQVRSLTAYSPKEPSD